MDDAKLELSREWLLKASNDLRSARKLVKGDDPLFDTAAFHCQQAAEKVLKGFLVQRDVPFEKTHNIVAILALVEPIDASFSALSDDAALLSPFAVAHRYPDEHSPLDRARFSILFAAAERVYRFVLAKHPELDPEKLP